ncbi:hypothetical protein EYZ11_010942 [Aspergillus tanneri]|uniref:Uncharacterized protein n=1 Tax=Aspergillus tanneri TaxID=1220188 RepID=A0A4S3J449_9EURO|nr:hypothetical protein EYZ11_010942 [Aspergillus tanneri]
MSAMFPRLLPQLRMHV